MSLADAALNGVYLWRHGLAALPPPDQLACLSPLELARAERFVFDRDSRRYLAARCALRERLARHLGITAAGLSLAEGPFGKPYLAQVPACHFNLSHSEDWALIGISDASAIGVDIEMLRPMSDAVSLAQSHFTPSELAAFMALDGASRDAAFLRVWTRKEACLKAIGTGLSVAPNELEVGLGPEDAIRLCIDLPEGPVRVVVWSIELGETLVGAVAKVVDK